MRKIQVGSFLALIAAVAVMAVNHLAVPLPDWTVRVAGVVMMLALACTAYSAVKCGMKK